MAIKILSEKDNPFFNRKELKIEISHPGKPTPSKGEVIKEVAQKFSVPEDKIRVDYIFSKKGLSESEANVKIITEQKIVEKKPREKKEEKAEKKVKKEPKKGGKIEAQKAGS